MKIVTFGELMIRLQPYNYERFVQADHLEFSFGGGEANVAVSLANYGMDAAFVTKLPAHAIGQAAVNSLRRYGVDTSMIVRGGDRIGIYFNEKGASQRGSVCIYDRAHSAIQEATTADFDWDKIFDGVDWFHFTGITPALGPNVVDICREACQAAKAHGVKISCDLNYRGKLWTREQAREAMTELCQYVDVCISNEEDAKDVFGIEAEATDIYAGEINHEGYKSVAKQLADKFGFEKVAITLRESHSASDNGWSAMLFDAKTGEYCFSKKYELRIIDRVGGGDSFGGGLIYALLNGKSTQEAVEFAVAASALKHTIEGDYNMVTVPRSRSSPAATAPDVSSAEYELGRCGRQTVHKLMGQLVPYKLPTILTRCARPCGTQQDKQQIRPRDGTAFAVPFRCVSFSSGSEAEKKHLEGGTGVICHKREWMRPDERKKPQPAEDFVCIPDNRIPGKACALPLDQSLTCI